MSPAVGTLAGFVVTNQEWFWVALVLVFAALGGLVRLDRRFQSNDTAAATRGSWAHIHKKMGTYRVFTQHGLFYVEKKTAYRESHQDVPSKWVLSRVDIPGMQPPLGGYDTKQECFEAIQKLLYEAERADRQ